MEEPNYFQIAAVSIAGSLFVTNISSQYMQTTMSKETMAIMYDVVEDYIKNNTYEDLKKEIIKQLQILEGAV